MPSYCCQNSECEDFEEEWSVVVSEGVRVCTSCGIVISETIIHDGPDWNDYDCLKPSNSRCGLPSDMHNPFDDQLGTYIPRGFRVQIWHADKKKFVWHDLANTHIRISANPKRKSFNIVKDSMKIAGDKLGLNLKILSTAYEFWAEVMHQKKLTRAGPRRGLQACCIFYATIKHDVVRNPEEICKAFLMEDTRDFNKGDKEIRDVFEGTKHESLLNKTSTANDLLDRFVQILGLKFVLHKECHRLYELNRKSLAAVSPKSAAAAIVYYVGKKHKYKLTKAKIAKELQVCNPTLNKSLKLIVSFPENEEQ